MRLSAPQLEPQRPGGGRDRTIRDVPSDRPFAELTDRAQVHRLRRVASDALSSYPVEPTRLRLLRHDFNTTFRLDTASGDTFAVRIGLNHRKSTPALAAEMAWLAAIDRDTDVVVPAPLATIDGRTHLQVSVDGVEGLLHLVVLSWLPGRDLDVPTGPAMHELGRQMAMLHDHASTWVQPPGVEFPRADRVLMDSPDRLRPGHPAISPERHALIVEALDHVESIVDAMVAAGERMPIHADLHPWNVKWLRNRMAIFDFDDAGIGVPAQDLAISNYYLPEDGRDELHAAMLDGYATHRELPTYTDEQFHAALAGRTLVLLNDLVDLTSGASRSVVTNFLHNVELRLRSYLDTGTYRAQVDGMVPLS